MMLCKLIWILLYSFLDNSSSNIGCDFFSLESKPSFGTNVSISNNFSSSVTASFPLHISILAFFSVSPQYIIHVVCLQANALIPSWSVLRFHLIYPSLHRIKFILQNNMYEKINLYRAVIMIISAYSQAIINNSVQNLAAAETKPFIW